MSHFMTSETNIADRLAELELKVTFQDDLIEKLNQALIQQQDDIRMLTKLLEKMSSDMQDLQESSVIDQKLEVPPPHY
ncbi:SlyX family protein [Aliikangiella marina]|uniref:Protein SlyX homolog n=2 Tax=Aliikangiella marina TaxID=1712262 RepID=A0A545THI3_9GAMM|nr:SlyX family protein [Aliikangiella marina]